MSNVGKSAGGKRSIRRVIGDDHGWCTNTLVVWIEYSLYLVILCHVCSPFEVSLPSLCWLIAIGTQHKSSQIETLFTVQRSSRICSNIHVIFSRVESRSRYCCRHQTDIEITIGGNYVLVWEWLKQCSQLCEVQQVYVQNSLNNKQKRFISKYRIMWCEIRQLLFMYRRNKVSSTLYCYFDAHKTHE